MQRPFQRPFLVRFFSYKPKNLSECLLRYIDKSALDYKKAVDDLASPNTDANSREELRRTVSKFEGINELYARWNKERSNYEELENLTASETDPDIKSMAKTDRELIVSELSRIELEIKDELLKPDAEDSSSAILEIRAGTGGDEAALFSAELFKMYQRFAEANSWNFTSISVSEDGPNSLREGIAQIDGSGVFGRLKWESGVHRVQRIPQTENQGRIHTSTATVAIMPKSDESERSVHIPEKDIRVDVYRSGGAGGQNAQKTNSAVRVVHIPTGMMVCIQEERNQQLNRMRATVILQARLDSLKRRSADSQRQMTRQAQIGNADRSDKIRTYNFPQGRITDHRIGHSIHCLEEFMSEGRGLDQIIDKLKLQEETDKLEALQTAAEVNHQLHFTFNTPYAPTGPFRLVNDQGRTVALYSKPEKNQVNWLTTTNTPDFAAAGKGHIWYLKDDGKICMLTPEEEELCLRGSTAPSGRVFLKVVEVGTPLAEGELDTFTILCDSIQLGPSPSCIIKLNGLEVAYRGDAEDMRPLLLDRNGAAGQHHRTILWASNGLPSQVFDLSNDLEIPKEMSSDDTAQLVKSIESYIWELSMTY